MFDFNQISLADIDEDSEFIPILSVEDEEKLSTEKVPKELPILPLRNTVLFPGVVIPITVGRDKSVKLINEAYASNKIIGVVSQKEGQVEDPSFGQLNDIGTVAFIIKVLKMPDGNTTVIIQGKRRFRIIEPVQTEPYFKAKIEAYGHVESVRSDKKFQALVGSLKDLALQIIKQSPNIPTEAAFAIKNIDNPSFLVNFTSSNMSAEVEEKQKLLEVVDLTERATLLLGHLTKELQMLELKNDIQSKVRTDIDKQQKEFFLHQQMKQIQEELGENPVEQEIEEMRKTAKKKKWNKDIAKQFNKELDKLQRMNPAVGEYGVQMNYLETLLDLPWGEYTKDRFDIKDAEKILNEDHYGLEKVKDRILEHLAVLKLKGNMKSPILCFLGPPGVGKTSLGKSVARALGRKYIRMSLGGLRDEAEIRGHRKTYIGAMPGRIIQNIKKAKSSNPVFVLDEIDKVGSDFHGDPSSALLEVLDPEQNTNFYDNYIEIDYDLSKVMFIATANTLNTVQPALRDRMEVIDISGYIVEEKIEIAKKYLIPKQLRENGFKKSQLQFSKEVLEKIVEDYTRESGVRNLEKRISKIIRYTAKLITLSKKYDIKIKPGGLVAILGPAYSKDKYQDNAIAGVVTGLAWTSVGGDILFIEVSLSKGKGKLTLTGNLGDVMKESAIIALEYLKANCAKLNLDADIFNNWNVHIHIPEGATPKDGPSAGITMFTALVSAFTQRKVKPKIAMTGELTLRGKVLPVGGIKEKILAAKRANITDIILPKENKKDIKAISSIYLKGLNFHYVNNLMEAVKMALLQEKVKSSVKV
ncbi:MAG TPA: endopeptidase La [Flavobacteriales bacterium]|nr:endopeptidase La [Flavobacteriales bacterium]HIN39333.1 endopeptidase La [Flavobacteriales bacterium]